MKLITIGDSITHGQYTGPNDSFPNSLAKPYGEYLKEYLGCEYINYGHNGVAFSHTSTVNSSIAFELSSNACLALLTKLSPSLLYK